MMLGKRLQTALLLGLAFLAGSWASGRDEAWVKIRYGAWGGPGVDAAPGPMDAVRVKDYAPQSSIVASETVIAKARFPVVDAHAHVNANTPEEVRAWVRTMDAVGIRAGGPSDSQDATVEYGRHAGRRDRLARGDHAGVRYKTARLLKGLGETGQGDGEGG